MSNHNDAASSPQLIPRHADLSPRPLSSINVLSHGRQRRRRLHYSSANSSRFIFLAICYTSALHLWNSHAFSPSNLQGRTMKFSSMNTSQKNIMFMSSIAEKPTESNLSHQADNNKPEPRLSDFQRRMKGLMKRNGTAERKEAEKPSNLKTVHTLLDYKDQMEKNSDKIVVVRFFATWCKACKAVQPSFYRMASLYPQITFLDVPVTNENANLHQGLEVPSLPFGHIYYPDAGLVEELKISKKHFPTLVKMVRWYDVGACGLDEYLPSEQDNEAN